MSLLWAWERILWPPDKIEAEARELRAAREPSADADGAPPLGRCRVCDYEGPERYCPTCLADTMVPVKVAPAPARRPR